MKDYCIECQVKNYQGDSGDWIEFEDLEGLGLYTEKFICSDCLEKLRD